MRVGLNATCFNRRPSGASQRFAGIYGELVRSSPDTEFVVYEPADCHVAAWFADATNVTVRRTPIPSQGRVRKVANLLRFSAGGFSRDGLDLLEGFNLPFLSMRRGANVLTIHDTRRLHADWPVLERKVYSRILARALSAADRIITVSQTMRQEILNFQPRAEVSVVYNGLEAQAFELSTEDEQSAVRCKFGLPSEFVLAVGHLERRKNYLRLIEAIALLRDRGRSVPLVIVGNDSGYGTLIRQAVNAAGLTNSVWILSALSDREVRNMYSLCSLFVFPSSYEGFGIPILEAMAAGKPMVLSDIAVFQEITEGKGLYFSPDDADAVATAIEFALSSPSSSQLLVSYGRERVRDFGFPELAQRIAALHASLLA
ncbi:glycosyltransferase family 4 protein [Consotaella aegiceratis]|uniref:glycosyltransferase family 4 protein n=1 Tax=Consotaella aegiceratis TaxID=3097961 RepID=UPI002F3F87BB